VGATSFWDSSLEDDSKTLLDDCCASEETGVLEDEFASLDALDEVVEDELSDLFVFDVSDEEDSAFFESSEEFGVPSSELDEMSSKGSALAELGSVQAVSAIDKNAEVPNAAIFASALFIKNLLYCQYR
jgi:hypothetical protein